MIEENQPRVQRRKIGGRCIIHRPKKSARKKGGKNRALLTLGWRLKLPDQLENTPNGEPLSR